MRGRYGRVITWRSARVRRAIAWSVARWAGPMCVITRTRPIAEQRSLRPGPSDHCLATTLRAIVSRALRAERPVRVKLIPRCRWDLGASALRSVGGAGTNRVVRNYIRGVHARTRGVVTTSSDPSA